MFRWCLAHGLCFGGISVMFRCCFAHVWVVSRCLGHVWAVAVSRPCFGVLITFWWWLSCFAGGVLVLFWWWFADGGVSLYCSCASG